MIAKKAATHQWIMCKMRAEPHGSVGAKAAKDEACVRRHRRQHVGDRRTQGKRRRVLVYRSQHLCNAPPGVRAIDRWHRRVSTGRFDADLERVSPLHRVYGCFPVDYGMMFPELAHDL